MDAGTLKVLNLEDFLNLLIKVSQTLKKKNYINQIVVEGIIPYAPEKKVS